MDFVVESPMMAARGSGPASPPPPPPPSSITTSAGAGPPPPPPSYAPKTDLPGNNTSAPPAPAPAKAAAGSSADKKRFVGKNLLQFALWAHLMSYLAALFCLIFGIFGLLWMDGSTYNCLINGELINEKYRVNNQGECTNTLTLDNGDTRSICCQPDAEPNLGGGFLIGGWVLIGYSVFLVLLEDTTFGFGLWYPNDSLSFKLKFSPFAIINFAIGVLACTDYSTVFAGGCLIGLCLVQQTAVLREESGDGGRSRRATAKKEGNFTGECAKYTGMVKNFFTGLSINSPCNFFKRVSNEDKLSSYVWVGIYLSANLAYFIYILHSWYTMIYGIREGLMDGTLPEENLVCVSRVCHMMRKIIRYGPPTDFAAWAKACGGLLNMNCALLLLPIIKLLLNKLNNIGTSFSKMQRETDFFQKFFAAPLTRYIPLSKNIEFHKLCAGMIFFYAILHTICHFANLIRAEPATTTLFYMKKWNPFAWFTGAMVLFAMYFLYTAALDQVRMAKYEIFFGAHHMFTIFYFFMFLHGPVFFYWTCIPVCLYVFERYLQTKRGNNPFLIVKVEWIPPVMAVYFRPVFKEHFPFKEGQYLHINCPHLSASEWHPFTISSAYDDLHFGPRISLRTGEEVMEVPRPKDYPQGASWNRYCEVSKDWRTMKMHEFLDKSDTGYFDYVSVHIKVHGETSWTMQLKNYFQEMQGRGEDSFPFYFYSRDARGDLTVGKQNGPDGKQILRIDGPHSAPSEHYVNYGTCMVIGAGIGLTPCASILTALTRYRWKKGFSPEILHFYWVVRQAEIESFQWLVHMLTEMSFDIYKGRHTKQIEPHYYCEVNIYVTGVDKKKTAKDFKPLRRPARKLDLEAEAQGLNIKPVFSPDQLYEMMLCPTVDPKGQTEKMRQSNADTVGNNRLQDIWVWSGRPPWDDVFKQMRQQRQHKDIGVCFCGAPVIGADLKSMCEKYSSIQEDCVFSLHKENF